jgi:hypothetical protein
MDIFEVALFEDVGATLAALSDVDVFTPEVGFFLLPIRFEEIKFTAGEPSFETEVDDDDSEFELGFFLSANELDDDLGMFLLVLLDLAIDRV